MCSLSLHFVSTSQIYLGNANDFNLECNEPGIECREIDIYSSIDPTNIDDGGLMNNGWNIECQSFAYCGCPNSICLYAIDIHFETIDTICEYTYQDPGCDFLSDSPTISPTQSVTNATIFTDKDDNEGKHSEYSGTIIGLIITIIILIWIFLAFKFCIYPKIRHNKKSEIPRKLSDASVAASEIELQKTEYGYASVSEDENRPTQIDDLQ